MIFSFIKVNYYVNTYVNNNKKIVAPNIFFGATIFSSPGRVEIILFVRRWLPFINTC